MVKFSHFKHYPSASEGIEQSRARVETPQTTSPSYTLAFADQQFMLRDEMRGVRLLLEMTKPELLLKEHGIVSTIVMFGGTRVPEQKTAEERLEKARQAAASNPQDLKLQQSVSRAARVLEKACYYEECRKLARMITEYGQTDCECHYVVTTGGGPGIMEAANRGAAEVGGKNIGYNIVLPHEQAPNKYITPELCFQFHYFAIRKMHFLMRAKALVVFPGGFGTMDEMFEALTIIQTKKMKPLPILLFGREFWEKAINFRFLLEEGLIGPADLEIFHYVETAEEAWKIIEDFYNHQADGDTEI
jgi:uncharacterized protein (TIGR00730 family)